jgi:hypothetical protein
LAIHQIGSFGAITRIVSIVQNRKDLIELAAAGPIAGFSLGLVLLLLGFVVPPFDGLGLVIDPSVFHESFLAGGVGKYLFSKFHFIQGPLPKGGIVNSYLKDLVNRILKFNQALMNTQKKNKSNMRW